MKEICISVCCVLIMTGLGSKASAQAFHKGSLLVSLSEGGTHAHIRTLSNGDAAHLDNYGSSNTNGSRDPLVVEYGLSDRWGIGINLGTDVLPVNTAALYHFQSDKAKATTSELTFDISYHYFTNKRLDLSAFTSAGISSVMVNANDDDHQYSYNASGGIVRLGTRARYYVLKRVGVFGMFSLYSSSYSPEGLRGTNIAGGVSTSMSGYAIEFGLCGRFF